MRRGAVIFALAAALLAACNDRSHAQEALAVTPGSSAGWHTLREGSKLTLVYEFPDGTTQFLGLCDERPVFSYLIGERPEGEAIVVADGTRLTPHGVNNALFLDEPADVDRIAKARTAIALELPGWQRAFKPPPDIARFVEECRRTRGKG